jgi:hypothetical protein
MFGVRGLDRAKAALLLAAALLIATPLAAQIADDGAAPRAVAPPADVAPAPAVVTAPGAAAQSFVIIIQFTDSNDAYLRGRPPTAQPPQGTPSLGDTIKGISQQFGMEYMGARCDPVTRTCMLRYMHNGAVVNFYVDSRTNKVIGREGF